MFIMSKARKKPAVACIDVTAQTVLSQYLCGCEHRTVAYDRAVKTYEVLE